MARNGLWTFTFLLLLLLGLTVLGCTSAEPSLPPLYPVKGRVLNNGQPVQGGSVRFYLVNEQAGIITIGAVDQEGRFELVTVNGRNRIPGAPAGTYQITYSPPRPGKGAMPVTLQKTYQIEARANEFTFDVNGD